MRLTFEIVLTLYAVIATYLLLIKNEVISPIKLERKTKPRVWDDKVWGEIFVNQSIK